GHIHAACAGDAGNRPGLRSGPLKVPNMLALGLGHAAALATGGEPARFGAVTAPQGFFGAAEEISTGKDTPSGHWEMSGVPVTFDWGYFPNTVPTFPEALTTAMIREASLP